MSQEVPLKPLRLLSLDGGGIRGFSELIILQTIMWRIRQKKWADAKKQNPSARLKEIPEQEPYDYFDLCGGTSTGGIIAILLFRMKLPVSKCLEIYSSLSKTIFEHKQGLLQIITTSSRYDYQILEDAIKVEVRKWSGDPDSLLLNPSIDSTKAFVTATLYSDASRDAPRILRTYRPGKNPDRDSNVKIWEAARATSAAPSYFQAITIKSQDEEEKLVDGGLGCNNPVYQVLEEARDHFPHREIACLVSIGTGIPLVRAAGEESPGYGAIWNLMMNIPVIKGGLDRWKQAQVLERVASTCEYTHQRMCKDARRDPELQGRYYRFNVAQGAQGISLEMWDRLDEVYTHTQNYIQTHDVAGRRVTHILDEVVNILYPGQM